MQTHDVAKVDSQFDAARALIRQSVHEQGFPSIAVAVAKDGRIVWEEGFGWADLEKKITATPDTLYSLASITKPFTATGLMRLVEQGKVELDKPANDYLGVSKIRSFVGDPSEATLLRILSHTSGLPFHYQFFYDNEPYRPPSMDETIARYGILIGLPDGTSQYSNLGYGILDYIISCVTNRSYADYMRTDVFLPLGLLHTSVGIAPGLEPYVAQRYDAQQRPIPFYTFDHVGASAIYSSAHDLVRFGMFHLKDHLADQQAILSDQSLDKMQKEIGTSQRGISWAVISNNQGYRSVSHGGGMPGVSTSLTLFPSEDLVVVILMNTGGNGQQHSRIQHAILGSMLPKYAEALRHDSLKPTAQSEVFVPQPEFVGEWIGTVETWQSKALFSMSIRADGDVHVKLGDNLETILNEPTFQNGTLSGRFVSSISTPDVSRYPHYVQLALWIRDGKLTGRATAITSTDPEHYGLTSYVELARKPAAK